MKDKTLIFDIDGTLVFYHTNKWLPNALEMLKNHSETSKIVLITMRGEHDKGTEWSIERTKETILKDLEKNGIDYQILFGMPSPRILYDDSWGCFKERQTNQDWVK